MKNNFFIIIGLCLIFLFFYYKKIYLIIFLCLFSNEFLNFLNFIFKTFKYRKQKEYNVIYIKNFNPFNFNNYELWLKYCEILAFKKIYSLFVKKKFNIINILLLSLLLIVNLPFKIINIMYFFIKNRKNLNNSLNELVFNKYEEVKNLKIEFINGNYYINCSTRSIIYSKILKFNTNATDREVLEIYKKLQHLNKVFNEYDKNLSNTAIFKLGKLKTEEGTKVKKVHWSHETNFVIKKTNEEIRSLIHATSNVPQNLDNSQFGALAMKNLIKSGSTKPGSVFTNGLYIFVPISNQKVLIPSWQLEYVVYDVYGETTLTKNIDLFEEKDLSYQTVMGAENRSDINDFSMGIHHQTLNTNINDYSLLEEIRNFKSDNNI